MNAEARTPDPGQPLVFIGTYTQGDSAGIYTCRLDLATGDLGHLNVAARVDNPSYLAIDGGRHRLFAVNELPEFRRQPGGGISAFSIQPSSGGLTLINQVNSQGGAPCYITVDQTGSYVLAVNYSGGSVVVVPVGEDGALAEPSGVTIHAGSSRHPDRQNSPHPHAVVLDSTNDFAFVPDLGMDKIMQYRFDRRRGRLIANSKPWIAAAAGSGPRHMVFSPAGKTAYVVGELDATITTYAYDPGRGTLEPRQKVSMLPEGYAGPNLAADIHLTPDGSLLYASNRGHDSIAAYAVDQQDGSLTLINWFSTEGRNPRGFTVDPTGTFLLVANQHSNEIRTFRIDKESGLLSPTGSKLAVPSPVCLKMMPTYAG